MITCYNWVSIYYEIILALLTSNVDSYNIKYCTAPSITSQTHLTWSNQTLDGAQNIVGGVLVEKVTNGTGIVAASGAVIVDMKQGNSISMKQN